MGKITKQYDAFSPGPNEWPALLKCDAVDQVIKNKMTSNIKNVAVIGTGVIGAGWIIRCLAHNKKVVAYDKDLKLNKRLVAEIKRTWPYVKAI